MRENNLTINAVIGFFARHSLVRFSANYETACTLPPGFQTEALVPAADIPKAATTRSAKNFRDTLEGKQLGSDPGYRALQHRTLVL